jgi:hypothetical protein
MVTFVNKPTPQDFIYAIVKNWASLVSGSLSVPFTALSVYLQNPNAKLISGLLGIAGIVFASYGLWAREREERVHTQDELELQTARLGRPEVTLGLKNDASGQLWVCMMNYSDRPAVNVRADDIHCGDQLLRFNNLPSQITHGFSPNIQVYCVDGKPDFDVATASILNGQKRNEQRFEVLQLTIRYSDIDGNEWVTYGRFFYNISTKIFELEKQWVERAGAKPKPVLT